MHVHTYVLVPLIVFPLSVVQVLGAHVLHCLHELVRDAT